MNDPIKHIFEQIVNQIEAVNRETKLEVLKTMKEGIDIAFEGIKENQDRILKLCEAVDTLQLAVKKILEKI